MAWRSGKSAKTPGLAKPKVQRIQKVKIRWSVLGLNPPAEEMPSMPIEEVRRRVRILASRGFGHGTRSRSLAERVSRDGGATKSKTVRRGTQA